jgi:hypothetical protein
MPGGDPKSPAGATFHKGKLLERPVNITPETPDADPKAVGSEVA